MRKLIKAVSVLVLMAMLATPVLAVTVDEILAFVSTSETTGALTGKVIRLERRIGRADRAIGNGKALRACMILKRAYRVVDGEGMDLVSGTATLELASKIQALRTELGCL